MCAHLAARDASDGGGEPAGLRLVLNENMVSALVAIALVENGAAFKNDVILLLARVLDHCMRAQDQHRDKRRKAGAHQQPRDAWQRPDSPASALKVSVKALQRTDEHVRAR